MFDDILTRLALLSDRTWSIRDRAHTYGLTKVGCAVLTSDGNAFFGCNVEHRYRCHDVHAEVNAIASMVSGGSYRITGVLVVAERDFFTPCGGCMDWIMQFAADDAHIAVQKERNGELQSFTAHELMPHYPH